MASTGSQCRLGNRRRDRGPDWQSRRDSHEACHRLYDRAHAHVFVDSWLAGDNENSFSRRTRSSEFLCLDVSTELACLECPSWPPCPVGKYAVGASHARRQLKSSTEN